MFRVSHTNKPGTTAIGFALTDYELARQHRDETDRETVEFLTGKQTVEPSKLDL